MYVTLLVEKDLPFALMQGDPHEGEAYIRQGL